MADSSPSSTPKAVFLSYAREDATVAHRIADALRGFAIEVWFDQSELRGGDAWDQKIRKQIKDCALFVPLISQATQARGEGYFRLEWKLAVERTHLMAEGHPFLVPIALGGLTESGAIVPAEFLRVQWTRFAGDVPTPAFIDQIHRLLNGPRGPVAAAPAVAPAGAASQSKGAHRRRWSWGTVTAIVVAIVVAVSVSYRQHRSQPQDAAPSAPAAPAAAAAPVDDKSIAVLPFANMSEEKDSVYFTDGVQEDILTDLALIHDLRVVSRTSVEQYRDTRKSIRQIGDELHVAYILEGSVRREGNQVRVTGQLIKAGSDEHVWAQAYNRSLTDIFAIQSELAQSIASALEAQITNRETDLLKRRPTQNVAAYELFLKARDLSDMATPGGYQRKIELLRSALQLDPDFAQAWGELADTYALAHFNFARAELGDLDKAKDAIDRAVKLAPDDPAIIADLGTYYYYGFRDYEKAAAQYQRLAQLAPNNPTLFNSLALIQRRQGHWHESIANARKAVDLEPNNAQFLNNLFSSLFAVNEWQEGLEIERRRAALRPDSLLVQEILVEDIHTFTGSTAEGEALIAHLTPAQAASPAGINIKRHWAFETGNVAEFIRQDRLQRYYTADGQDRFDQDVRAAMMYRLAGDPATCAERIASGEAKLAPLLAESPDNANYLLASGHLASLRGDKAAAKKYYDRARAVLPISRDAVQGAADEAIVAIGMSYCDPDEAAAAMERLEFVPGSLTAFGLTRTALTTSPYLAQLRNSSRIKALTDRVMNRTL